MVDDAILSREAYLIYQNSVGFEPVQGNLTQWFGPTRDKSSNQIDIRVEIPDNYPQIPPDVYLSSNISHPNISNGKFLTRSISRWKSTFHIYQIIREVRQVIAASTISTSSVPTATINMDDSYNRQLNILHNQLNLKKKEFEEMKAQSGQISNSQVNQTINEITQDVLVDIQNDLYNLEDTYDRADIDGLKFAREFLQLQKRAYMIQKSK